MTRYPHKWFCPIHLGEIDLCGPECEVADREMMKADDALWNYWYERRRGVKPAEWLRRRMQRETRAA